MPAAPRSSAHACNALKVFQGRRAKAKQKEQRYCSRACRFIAQSKQVVINCAHCGKQIIRPPSASSGQRFCSYACRAYALSVGKTIGIKLHQDRQPRPYSLNYWRRQASRARRRDGYQCQDCGKLFQKGDGNLQVHHKIPVRLNGSDHLSNLISLCRKCHRKADAAIQKQELLNWPPDVPRPKHIRHKPLPNHCKRGHELTPANVIRRTDNNGRRCRICYLARNKRRYQEGKANPAEMERLKAVGKRFAKEHPDRLKEIWRKGNAKRAALRRRTAIISPAQPRLF